MSDAGGGPASRAWRGRQLHLVGIGGAGMSAYARAAHALGARVTGSDVSVTHALQRLRDDDIADVAIGHDAANLPRSPGVELVYSSAIDAENPERRAARERGVPERSRADLLGELTALRRTIAVAGTHGKTTTAAMLVQALLAAGMDPGWLVGAAPGPDLENGHWSESDWLVVEADESDRSMLSIDTQIALVTNVELDHHSSFASLGEMRDLFRAFLRRAPQAVVWGRGELLALREGPVDAYDATDVSLTAGGSRLRWRGREVALQVPGAHNAVNASGALEAATLAGADPSAAAAGIERFRGATRRFERLGLGAGGALIIDDYAHHPTEVAATLTAARTLPHRRLVAAFQPHLFSRTALLAAEFGAALSLADVVAVLDVYAARERAEDHPGVSGLLIAEAAADVAGGRQVLWLPTLADARSALPTVLREGDICMVMGAGDVDLLARALAQDGNGR